MTEKENFEPRSPLGQPYTDMTLAHAFLRNPTCILHNAPSVLVALNIMHMLHATNNKQQAFLPQAQENTNAREFLNAIVAKEEHWRALFSILRDAGYTSKNALIEATKLHLAQLTFDGRKFSRDDQDALLKKAQAALEVVFNNST